MPHTLLLADDSLAIHRVVELTFAGQPIDVVAVRDGASAVARLEEAPPDIILADIAMPAPTGYDIAAHVKRTPHLAAIPVVLLTGAFEPVDEARARASGCAGVLAKPFDPDIVVRRVNELLQQGSGQPSAAPAPAFEEAADEEDRPLPTTSALVRNDADSAANGPQSGPAQRSGASGDARAERSEPGFGAEPREKDAYFERLDKSLTAFKVPAAPPPVERKPDAAPPDFGATFAAAEAPAPSVPAPVPADAVEHATRQFFEQGGRDVVREIVSQVAERLIREEIERIKAEIERIRN